jgi:hypothetical protein
LQQYWEELCKSGAYAVVPVTANFPGNTQHFDFGAIVDSNNVLVEKNSLKINKLKLRCDMLFAYHTDSHSISVVPQLYLRPKMTISLMTKCITPPPRGSEQRDGSPVSDT